jgi:hypothetical protein
MNLMETENLRMLEILNLVQLAENHFMLTEKTEESPTNILGNELGTFRDELDGDGKPPTVRNS